MKGKAHRRGEPFAGKSRLDPAAFAEGGTAIERHGGEKFIDMRGVSVWKTVLGVDCSEYSWGQVIVTGEAKPSLTVSGANNPENRPWIEVRIVADVNGQRILLLVAAVATFTDGGFFGTLELGARSPGPILLPLSPGEVPDRIEVQALARRGGLIETHFDADEILKVRASTRFHT